MSTLMISEYFWLLLLNRPLDLITLCKGAEHFTLGDVCVLNAWGSAGTNVFTANFRSLTKNLRRLLASDSPSSHSLHPPVLHPVDRVDVRLRFFLLQALVEKLCCGVSSEFSYGNHFAFFRRVLLLFGWLEGMRTGLSPQDRGHTFVFVVRLLLHLFCREMHSSQGRPDGGDGGKNINERLRRYCFFNESSAFVRSLYRTS